MALLTTVSGDFPCECELCVGVGHGLCKFLNNGHMLLVVYGRWVHLMQPHLQCSCAGPGLGLCVCVCVCAGAGAGAGAGACGALTRLLHEHFRRVLQHHPSRLLGGVVGIRRRWWLGHHWVATRRWVAAVAVVIRVSVLTAWDLVEHALVRVAEVRTEYPVDEWVDDAGEVCEERRRQVGVRRHGARVSHDDLEELCDAEWRHEDEEEDDDDEETGDGLCHAAGDASLLVRRVRLVSVRRLQLVGVCRHRLNRTALLRLANHVCVAEDHCATWYQETDDTSDDDVVDGGLVTPVNGTDHLPVVVVIPVENHRYYSECHTLEPRVANHHVDPRWCHQCLVFEWVDDCDVTVDADERQCHHWHDYETVVCGTRKIAPHNVHVGDIADQRHQRGAHDDWGRCEVGQTEVHNKQVRDMIAKLCILEDGVNDGRVTDHRS